ncbi:MAG: methionine--tRNA ligase [Thermoplasmata archaeon]|nr:methionine--tRNA ligase [Thermoplasmata archaeon]
MSRIFIGVAWPYANGPFHLGHLVGAYLPADEFARFHRLRGNEVLMVSGSDMHGTPVSFRAEREGVPAETIAVRYDAVNRESIQKLGLSYDLFTSTHTPLHAREVQDFFLILLRAGYADRRTAESPYCPKEHRFLPDRYLLGTCPHCGFEQARGDECTNCGRVLEPRELGSPRCSLCGTPAEFRPSEHFYLRLDKLAPELARYLADKSYWRDNVRAFTENFRSAGLHPTPITRDLAWGIPIPLDGYDGKVFYVWFEAVIGYLSASKEWAERSGDPEAWRRFWDPGSGVRPYYFLGKDNIFHHTLFWPAMLLGRGGLALPYDVPANEWLRLSGGKLSKSPAQSPGASAENPLELPALLARWPADVIRFYGALRAPQNHDSDYSEAEFESIANEVLSNQWGNLVQRLLVFVRDKCAGVVPAPPDGWTVESSEVGRRLRAAHAQITAEFDAVRLKQALELALVEIREANRRFQEAKPWSAPPEERARALYEGLWFLRAASTWLAPVIPSSSEKVQRMLGLAVPLASGGWDRALEPLAPGTRLGEVTPLFPRPEGSPGRTSPPPRTTPGVPASAVPRTAPRLELRAGRITSVAAVEGADRLYRLGVDLGPGEARTVVAGLRPHLTPEELDGRRVVLLANLEPRKIRSTLSDGMILAAEWEGKVYPLLPAEGVEPGAGSTKSPEPLPRLSYAEFEAGPLRVARVESSGPERSRATTGEGTVEVAGSWPVGTKLVLRLAAGRDGPAEVLALEGGKPVEVAEPVGVGARVR